MGVIFKNIDSVAANALFNKAHLNVLKHWEQMILEYNKFYAKNPYTESFEKDVSRLNFTIRPINTNTVIGVSAVSDGTFTGVSGLKAETEYRDSSNLPVFFKIVYDCVFNKFEFRWAYKEAYLDDPNQYFYVPLFNIEVVYKKLIFFLYNAII